MNAKELFASIPQLTLLGKGREYLDVVEYTKLLGVKLRSFFIIKLAGNGRIPITAIL